MSITINFKVSTRRSAVLPQYFSGKVKWFNPKIGYGFITTNTGDEVFVHYNQIKMDGYRKLTTGQNVSFGIKPYGTYQQATEVRINESNTK